MFKKHAITSKRCRCFNPMFSVVNACLWMLDDHAHVMQVKLCKANTRGVIAQLCRPPWPMSSLLRQASEPTLYTHRCGTSRRSRRWWPHRRWPHRWCAMAGQRCALLLCVWRVGPRWLWALTVSVYRIDFLIYFIDLNAYFKNSYLKLGVSNFGEPNFVSFILKCSIW